MKNILSSVVLLLIALVSPAFADLAGTKPNIILIMTDDQRYRYVGPAGPVGKGRNAGAPSAGALYDMEVDPGQTSNIIAQHPEVVASMRAAYEQYWKEACPLMVNETAPMSPTKPYHEWFQQQKSATGIPDWQAPKL